mmetsp:Transcript_4451/g.10217  ORF Transcript_4451/g.10217 Transcript_4451/m.10217 type:complete len:426 (-) Transcript_4451:51-1328(-)|eukprot:CAMPEP_0197929014 /NCGR_PEP_ID=MMETSP1439-20131203/103204_1 /TAXON_ID=66791 /ORGANISM="Gonyaulax spinifera, Strain CCMP409" /LENGTH=425 /DNA_ID=CAMNT_0043551637 /DNA_START=35 /DNA_END=1312 /DNA_ORIENTATION=-
MPKAQREKLTKPMRHNPLAEQIIEEEGSVGLRKTPRTKRRTPKGEEEEEVIPASLTQKVLEVAQAQKADEDDFDGLEDEAGPGAAGDQDEEVLDVEVDEDGYVVAHGATEEEERALSLFLPAKGAQQAGPTLADIILQKIQDHENRAQRDESRQQDSGEGMSPKVIQVYGEIGTWLKHYKTGKIPKAFKVIPNLTNWEEVLSLTSPLTWSPAAMYEAVNIFASNLNPRMAQRFYNLVLLPAVRQDIADHNKLNFHHFRALRKALFKPAGFFKGVLLPLASESCTLREAVILSAVLSKASIPPMHAAATVLRLCVMTPWYGTTSILMAALINKKYALPVRVIDALVSHFAAFASEEQVLPVVWHRTLLIFVQRYKFELSDFHKQRLKELLRVHFHESIGSEVRRELLAPKPNQLPAAAQPAAMEIG